MPTPLRVAVRLIGILWAACLTVPSPAAARPHILLIVADDLGWRDVGYHGSEIETPHIDRIANEGIELDRFYAQPSCSPTRAALMTGKSPLRLGIDRPISKIERTGLPLEETLLPEVLAGLGYRRWLVGKWHLGHYTPDWFPQARGFEHFYGSVTGGIGYWDHNHGGGHDWQRNGRTLREEGYTTHLVVEEAERLLDSADDERPIFLYAAFHAPHLPNEAPPATIQRYGAIEDERRRIHAAMVSELDAGIGRLLASFERRGMLANTLVFFASDNGGATPAAVDDSLRTAMDALVWAFGRPLPVAGVELLAVNVLDGGSDNRPLPKGKGSVSEGGVRVPAAIWWPGRLEGGRHDGFMTVSDVLPTLLEAIGGEDALPQGLDGRSQWSALQGADAGEPPDYLVSGLEGVAVYRYPWKLIDPDAPRLYHLTDDPLETRDRAADAPDLVAELVDVARRWPRGAPLDRSIVEILWDPDSFGGVEDREPWADVARERSRQAESP
ncbi:MAG: arylsulfatase [Myxococcota bacterium]